MVQLNPTLNAYYNRAVTYYQTQQFQAAIKDFECAIQIDHYYPSAYYGRGNAKYALGDQAGALKDYEIARSLSVTHSVDSNDEHAFYAKGIAFSHLGNAVEAMKLFQSAERLCLENANLSLLKQTREAMQTLSNAS